MSQTLFCQRGYINYQKFRTAIFGTLKFENFSISLTILDKNVGQNIPDFFYFLLATANPNSMHCCRKNLQWNKSNSHYMNYRNFQNVKFWQKVLERKFDISENFGQYNTELSPVFFLLRLIQTQPIIRG